MLYQIYNTDDKNAKIVPPGTQITFPFRQQDKQKLAVGENGIEKKQLEQFPSMFPAAGLLKLYKITGEEKYLELAKKLFVFFQERIVHCPEVPDIHGGIMFLRGDIPDINGWFTLEFLETGKFLLELEKSK